MSPEDKKRLERERDIFLSRFKGPDPKVLERDIQRGREEIAKGNERRRLYLKQQSEGWRNRGQV
jgi:hypothetical protein